MDGERKVLKRSEGPAAGVRRIICARIDEVIRALREGGGTPSDHTVHQIRKELKQARAALRMIRAELGEDRFTRENQAFRDAARPFAAVRDAKVLVDRLDEVIGAEMGGLSAADFGGVRTALVDAHCAARRNSFDDGETVSKTLTGLRAAKKRAENWKVAGDGWNSVSPGVKKAYGQGRRAMKRAFDAARDEDWHEWRKRAKDMRYQLELLTPMRPKAITAIAKRVHRLTDLLGEDHDLAVLRDRAGGDGVDGQGAPVEMLTCAIEKRRARLRSEAKELGEKVYGGGAGEFVDRLTAYWKSWGAA